MVLALWYTTEAAVVITSGGGDDRHSGGHSPLILSLFSVASMRETSVAGGNEWDYILGFVVLWKGKGNNPRAAVSPTDRDMNSGSLLHTLPSYSKSLSTTHCAAGPVDWQIGVCLGLEFP